MKKILITVFSLIVFNAAFATADSTLKEFTGKYVFPDGSVVSQIAVVLEGESLTMVASIGSSPLERKDGDVFNIIQFSGTAVFTRDANKKITGVTIDAMGYHLEGTKTDNGFVFNLNTKALKKREAQHIISLN